MKIINEYGGMSHFSELGQVYKDKRVLLVTGKQSYSGSGAKLILDKALEGENVITFSDFSVNPKIEDAIRGANLARASGTEVIIAIGGGSVIDIAKLIKAFIHAKGNELDTATGKLEVSDPGMPLIAIPTTAGSGSEATHFAVVYVGPDKYSLAAQCLLPSSVVLDGQLVQSGNSYLKKCNVLDAMSQAIESYWSIGATAESEEYALSALRLGWGAIQRFVNDTASSEDTQKIVEAANFAGKAINISKTTAAHAWSYAFTSTLGVPHGHAVWLTLPAIFEIHFHAGPSDMISSKAAQDHKHKMKVLCDVLKLKLDESLEMQLRNFMRGIGLEHTMEAIGLSECDARKAISQQVNMERMGNNPVVLDQYIQKIFGF
jgi:alcohol dehydrogenase class IV